MRTRSAMVWAVLAVAVVVRPVEAGPLTLRTERVVVFKDGHALVIRSGEAVANEKGEVFTEEVPDAAVLGSFWAFADGDLPLRSMRAEWLTEEKDQDRAVVCATPGDLLRANPEHRVVVDTAKETFSGTTRNLPAIATEDATEGVHPWETSGIAALDTGRDGVVVLPLADIQRVRGSDLTLSCAQRERAVKRHKRLTLDFGPAAARKNVKVHLLYFAPGMRWIPTYRLELEGETRGELFLQAELLNELEDLRGAAVDLVVGVPNFRFQSLVSPLSLEGVLRNALLESAPALMGQASMMTNALFTQKASEWEGAPVDSAVMEEATQDDGDLFVFPLEKLDLPKGARAVVPLWREQLKLRGLFTLDIRMVRGTGAEDSVSYGGRDVTASSPLRLARAQVWHQLELQNPGTRPWTTGAALVMDGFLPQAQELLTYTQKKGTTLMPLTIAVDVGARHEEVEVSRKEGALQSNGRSYALINKKGLVTVKNPRRSAAALEVRLSTGGKVERVSDGGRVKRDEGRYTDFAGVGQEVNPHSDVTWSLTLAPGEQRTLSYDVSFYK